VLYAANVAEDELPEGNEHVELVKKIAAEQGAEVVVVSAQVEAELALLEATSAASTSPSSGSSAAAWSA
jgi:ribosome-binding ATPase